jgi:hypothetical protein
MRSVKAQLIALGNANPEMRSDIRQILVAMENDVNTRVASEAMDIRTIQQHRVNVVGGAREFIEAVKNQDTVMMRRWAATVTEGMGAFCDLVDVTAEAKVLKSASARLK